MDHVVYLQFAFCPLSAKDVSASAAATSGAAASTMRTTRAEATACANCGNVLMPHGSIREK